MLILPSIGILCIVGLLIAFHPYVSGVFTTIGTALRGHGLSSRRIAASLGFYILTQCSVLFGAVLLLSLLFTFTTPSVQQVIDIAAGSVLAYFAVIECRAWLAPRQPATRMPAKALRWARKTVERDPSMDTGIYIALCIALLQLQFLIVPLLAAVSLTHLALGDEAIAGASLITIIASLPLFVVWCLLLRYTHMSTIKRWQLEHASLGRFLAAVGYFVLAWLLLLQAGRIVYIG